MKGLIKFLSLNSHYSFTQRFYFLQRITTDRVHSIDSEELFHSLRHTQAYVCNSTCSGRHKHDSFVSVYIIIDYPCVCVCVGGGEEHTGIPFVALKICFSIIIIHHTLILRRYSIISQSFFLS